MLISSLIVDFFKCSLRYQHFFRNLDYHSVMCVCVIHSILHKAIHVLVARHFYSNGQRALLLLYTFSKLIDKERIGTVIWPKQETDYPLQCMKLTKLMKTKRQRSDFVKGLIHCQMKLS